MTPGLPVPINPVITNPPPPCDGTVVNTATSLPIILKNADRLKFIDSRLAPGMPAVVADLAKEFLDARGSLRAPRMRITVRGDDGLSINAARIQVLGRIASLNAAIAVTGLERGSYRVVPWDPPLAHFIPGRDG